MILGSRSKAVKFYYATKQIFCFNHIMLVRNYALVPHLGIQSRSLYFVMLNINNKLYYYVLITIREYQNIGILTADTFDRIN